MIKKWIYLFAVFVFILSSAGAYRAEAATQMELSSRIEGVLVVDVSKSMLSSDPNGLSNEAMKMFVDMSSIKGDKIGVIAYGNDVESKKDLTRIQTEADKQAIKGFIDSLGKYNNTDISVGVAEALKFLDTGHESGYIPLIVVLADGNNDLDKTKPKTNQQADEQLAQSVVDAKAKGYPIYVIGLNADGKLNKQLLQNIAAGTNGKFFETNNAADLPGILSEIFADHLMLKMVPVKDVTATEEFQDVPFTVPNENVLEANISLISSKPVELKLVDPSGKEVAIPSDNISLTKSKNYSMLKLLNPVQGNWTLKVKGFPQDKVDVKLVFNNDLQLKLAPLVKNIKTGDTVKIEAFFEDNGKKIVNKDLYPTLKASLFVKDSASGKTEEIPLKAGDKGFFGEFKAGDSASYELTVKAEGNSFFRETKPQTIEVATTGGKDIEPVAGDVSPSPSKNSIPWLYIAIAAAVVFLLAVPSFSYASKKKKENRGFSGQIVVEIMDEETGVSTEPKVKKLKAFKGEFHLRQLFLLDQEFSETDQITFVPITDNTLLLLNKSSCTIDMGGELIDAETGHRLRRNDKLCIHLPELHKAIYIENVS
ncbi:vWA domain-containing protein [Neobacillus rhizophilus]|uniref:VWA domain-containing protein n=1 Tax=Neobacillus rhizophilus TaxID=2833579 RepID=A0A942YVL8_9BACI|nr:vWA domain-containing protein [Neobacillus rhizophilus]MBS4213105.1 VWA domain-containing protein [Neobacillus rhizophilus]